MLVIAIDGLHEVGEVVVQAQVGHDGQHVVDETKLERVIIRVEVKQERYNV